MVSKAQIFERSISLNDLDVALVVREQVQRDLITPSDDDDAKHQFLQTSSQYSFVLPSFQNHSLDFMKFLYSYLLDMAIYKVLVEGKSLNWSSCAFPMVPVLTMGDGNCLMHAASIGMWAINDRYQILRKTVYNAMIEDTQGHFHRRWQQEHHTFTQQVHGGYEMTEEQWNHEWQEILRLISSDQAPTGPNALPFESLEEIHIFVLANVLRRTIIVLSDDTLRGNYDESLSPINFSGIYLPLNWDPVDCVKTPLVIGYAHGHFTSIVSFVDGKLDQNEAADDVERTHVVPLVKHDGTPLTVHFLLEEEENFKDGLQRQYLDCAKATHTNAIDGRAMVTLVARLQFTTPPDSVQNLVDGYFARASETYQHMLNEKKELEENREPSVVLEKCRTEGCTFFGTSQTTFLCSKCLDEHLRKEGGEGDTEVAGLAGVAASPGVEVLQGLPPAWLVGQQQQYKEYQQQRMQGGQRHQEQNVYQQQEQQLQPQQHGQRQQQQQRYQELKQGQQQQSQPLQPQYHEQQRVRYEEQERRELQEYEEQRQRQQELPWQQQQQQQQLQQQQQQQQREQHQQTHLPQTLISSFSPTEQQSPKCATSGCKYNAIPEIGRWCLRCYESEANPEEASARIASQLKSKLCSNSVNGCKYFGLPGQHDLCSRCHRRFCIKMETTHAGSLPAAVPQPPVVPSEPLPHSAVRGAVPQPSAAPDACQEPNCRRHGVPELYGRCVECYSQCIRTFISSEERTVNIPLASTTQYSPAPISVPTSTLISLSTQAPISPPEPSTPPQVNPQVSAVPLPTFKQFRTGSLCATPGCLHEKMSGSQELCLQCFQIQPRTHTARPIPLTEEHPTIINTGGLTRFASQAEARETFKSPSGIIGGLSRVVLNSPASTGLYCTSGMCNNPVGCFTGDLCPQCFSEQHEAATPTIPSPSSPQQSQPQHPAKCQAPGCQQAVGNNTGGFCQLHVISNLPASVPHIPNAQPLAGRDARKQVPRLFIPPASQAAAMKSTPSPYNAPITTQGAPQAAVMKATPSPYITPITTPGATHKGRFATPGVTPLGNESAIRCATPNCTYFGIKGKNFLCSSCYQRNFSEWQKLSVVITSPSIVVTSSMTSSTQSPSPARMNTPASTKCAMEGCKNQAAHEYNGLCQSCYYRAVHYESQWNAQQQRAADDRQRPLARTSQQQQVVRPSNQQQANVRPQPAPQPQAMKSEKTNFVNTGTPCKTMGCLRFGTPEKDGLCEVCFERFQRKQAHKVRSSATPVNPSAYSPQVMAQNPQAVLTNSTFSAQGPVQVSRTQNVARFGAGPGLRTNKCVQPGCNMYGTPETNGYCSKCLMDQMRSAYPESVPDISLIHEVTDEVTQRPSADSSRGVTSHATPAVCSVSDCNNLANPYLRSHCTQCFEKYYPELAESQNYLPAIIADYHIQ